MKVSGRSDRWLYSVTKLLVHNYKKQIAESLIDLLVMYRRNEV